MSLVLPTFSGFVQPAGGGAFANTLSGSFDGTNDYLSIADAPSLTISGDLTISAWVKRAQLANGEYLPILTKRPQSHPSTNYSFYLDALDGAGQGGLRFYDGNNVISPASATAIPANTWTHVAVSVNSGVSNGTKWYINGVAETNSSTATINKTNSDPVFIGKLGDANIYGEGLIDEVALFNSALSASDITAIYNSGVPNDLGTDGLNLSPVAWYRMGDGTGDTDSGGGAPADADSIGTVANQGSASSVDATVGGAPTYSSTVPS